MFNINFNNPLKNNKKAMNDEEVKEQGQEPQHTISGEETEIVDGEFSLEETASRENASNEYASSENASSAEAANLERLKAQLSESNDKFLRLAAEFENYKKRTSKERSELFKTAGKDVLVAVIPVLDDAERAIRFNENATDVELVKDGLTIILSKMKHILAGQGLKEITSLGEKFDTDRHEAITNIPAPTPEQVGVVVDEVEKGYLLGDKVIRFAKVVVGQ